MDILRTVKKCVFKNNSTLRMMVSTESVWFIFLEDPNQVKEMLCNDLNFTKINMEFEHLKCNPLINGGDNERDKSNG